MSQYQQLNFKENLTHNNIHILMIEIPPRVLTLF